VKRTPLARGTKELSRGSGFARQQPRRSNPAGATGSDAQTEVDKKYSTLSRGKPLARQCPPNDKPRTMGRGWKRNGSWVNVIEACARSAASTLTIAAHLVAILITSGPLVVAAIGSTLTG
jgi:hypothetical protein